MACLSESNCLGARFIASRTVSLISQTPTGAQYSGPMSRQMSQAPDLRIESMCSSTPSLAE